jgi:two-component system chemotaxis sensor kinase CheA
MDDMDEFEAELKREFFAEAKQILTDIEQVYLNLEKDIHNIDLINEIFRLTHTMKGSSRAVGLGEVAEFTHEMENLIMQLQKGCVKISSAIITILLECNDHVRVMIEGLIDNPDAKFDSKDLISRLKNILPKR